MLSRLAALLSAVCVVLTLVSCNKENNESIADSTAEKKPSADTSPSPVGVKKYEFPEFLGDLGDPDMLSNRQFTSFDPVTAITPVEEQPFENYECENCFHCPDGDYYTYREDQYVGLLNSMGTVMVKADKYTSAELVTPQLVKLDYDSGRHAPAEYAKISAGYATMTENAAFDEKRISFEETAADNDRTVYLLKIDGEQVSDVQWESYSEIPIESLATTRKNYSKAFKATSGGLSYIIVFDKYCNFDVYEGVYGMIGLKVGSVYGECYILDGDDYVELTEMISSFGSESYVSLPSKDSELDFIHLTLGMNGDRLTNVTISSDGYCLTEVDADGDQPADKYFSVLSKETFVDLVNWVNETLSSEYVSEQIPTAGQSAPTR